MAPALTNQLLADFVDGELTDHSPGTVIRFVCHAATPPLRAAATRSDSQSAIA
jgi:hypothetical protein